MRRVTMASDANADYEAAISGRFSPSYETVDLSTCRTVTLTSMVPCSCVDTGERASSLETSYRAETAETSTPPILRRAATVAQDHSGYPQSAAGTIRLDDFVSRGEQATQNAVLDAPWYAADASLHLPPVPLEGKGTLCQWKPNMWQPVFWGIEDHFPGTARRMKGSLVSRPGPPTRLRILYPSVDIGQQVPILDDYGTYPLIVFCHGQCLEDPDIFLRWTNTLVPLARSGYIVVIPRVPYFGQPPVFSAARLLLLSVISWMKQAWAHSGVVGSKLGIIAHSYGAVATAPLVAEAKADVSAYTALSGAFYQADVDASLTTLGVPSLFMGGGAFDNGAVQGKFPDYALYAWNAIKSPKHGVIFAQGRHYDYLEVPTADIGEGNLGVCPNMNNVEYMQGACSAQWLLARDMLVTFFSRYMPPTYLLPEPFTAADETLLPPTLADLQQLNQSLVLTDQCKANHEYFFGGHMGGRTTFANTAACSAKILWSNLTKGEKIFP